jgi:hypothetical protein
MITPIRFALRLTYEKFKDWFFLKFRNPYGLKPYGCAPVQAEGYLPTGEWYYFRARGRQWGIDICQSEKDWWNSQYLWTAREKYPDASCMPTFDVIKLATKAIKQYANQRNQSR